MTTALTDFLRERATEYAVESEARRVKVAEWRAAVERLLALIQGWLKEADPDGLLKKEVDEWEINEQGLGKYKVPCLNINGLGRWVGVIPKARFTVTTANPPQKSAPVQAAGRVDFTNEAKRFVLYRFKGDPDDIWMIDDLTTGMKPFDREQFEAVLMSYLK